MHGGGAERVAALLCNHWAASGFKVILMPTFSGRGTCAYKLSHGVRIEFLADRVKLGENPFLGKIRRLLALRQAILEYKPDVIVSFLSDVNIATLIATYFLKFPVVVSERIYPPSLPCGVFMNMLRRITYPRAQAVVMQTGKGFEWLLKKCPGSKGCVIPNPIVFPLPSTEPHKDPLSVIKNDRKLIIAVGRLEKQKGFDILIDAYARLAEDFPDWDLVVLGEGSERDHLEEQIGRKGVSSRISLPGRVGNLGVWYARADFFVMSSRFEGFPNVLVEAMAYGLPAVSFDCDTGPEDIIENEVNGFLVSLEDGAQGLSRAMVKMIREEKKRMLMSESSQLVRRRFSMDRIVVEWNQVLGLEDEKK
jgi:GalNAc-alpha-(1->4)-GalNAc-alpha-(1->3)-diNAcBac-PP-undecaprenol alpha-1,4-N-acetyl-D-galactosaminyltransferase